MSTTIPPPATRLDWPDGLDERAFLERHWQRAPLLLRQALPGFRTPLPPDELAGLATEPDTAPRLVRRDRHGRRTLEHGPFDAATFAALGPADWSLLVTDVEKHLPELRAWLAPFRFVPDWRFDDLMISYAPDGASVGAHVDEYDVFLLQASGTRRWSIDARAASGKVDDEPHRLVEDGDLRLLADFDPTDTWELAPGDLLYLPPGVPHHGVAVGEDCTTWSIGYRAPSGAELVQHVAEIVAERMPAARLRDAGLGRGEPGRIDDATLAAVDALWRAATTLDSATLRELTGRLLTRPDAATEDDLPPSAGEDPSRSLGADARDAAPSPTIAPFARLAWIGEGESVRLFADGECLDCPRALAVALCESRATGEDLDADAIGTAAARAVLERLRELGVLRTDDDVDGRVE